MSEPQPPVPEIDPLLHEPARLRVLALLAAVDEADFMFLLRQTGLSRGNLSVQMGRLEAAKIVDVDRRLDGHRKRTVYSLSSHGLESLKDYSRTMQVLLTAFTE